MASILIAGRVGSAMTAELASMSVYEEIDALKTEGNDIELRLKVKSPEEFSKILSSLEDSLQSGRIEKLLDIIKHGKNTLSPIRRSRWD